MLGVMLPDDLSRLRDLVVLGQGRDFLGQADPQPAIRPTRHCHNENGAGNGAFRLNPDVRPEFGAETFQMAERCASASARIWSSVCS